MLVAASAAERIDLNGEWRMAVDRAGTGVAEGWTAKIPPAAEAVTVPHTWNIGKYADHEGVAWYFRTFTLPAGAANRPALRGAGRPTTGVPPGPPAALGRSG